MQREAVLDEEMKKLVRFLFGSAGVKFKHK